MNRHRARPTSRLSPQEPPYGECPTVPLAFVLVEHTDNATVLRLGQCHQFFHDKRCLYGIVDVGHQVFDTINDAEVWFDGPNGYIDHLAAFLESKSAQIIRIDKK